MKEDEEGKEKKERRNGVRLGQRGEEGMGKEEGKAKRKDDDGKGRRREGKGGEGREIRGRGEGKRRKWKMRKEKGGREGARQKEEAGNPKRMSKVAYK